MLNLHDVIDVIGLIGIGLFLLAVYRTSIGGWHGKSLLYELDIIGSVVCLTVYSYSKGAYLSVVTTVIWGGMAFKGLTSYAERRRERQGKSRRKA